MLFRRNSSDKTMNAAFLTKVFGCPVFVADYKSYISTISNIKKISAKKPKKIIQRKFVLWLEPSRNLVVLVLLNNYNLCVVYLGLR